MATSSVHERDTVCGHSQSQTKTWLLYRAGKRR